MDIGPYNCIEGETESDDLGQSYHIIILRYFLVAKLLYISYWNSLGLNYELKVYN